MRREGVKRMVFGSILAFLVAPGIFVAALVLGITNAVSGLDFDTVGPGDSVNLTAGEEMSIFVYTGAAASSDGIETGSEVAPPSQQCSMTGPDGSAVQLRRDTGTSYTTEGERWSQAYKVTPPVSGDYTLRCGADRAMVMNSGAFEGAFRSVGVALVVAFVVPFVVGVIGLGLLIWGIVRYNKTKPRQGGYQPPAGYSGGAAPYQGQYGQQPPVQYGESGQYQQPGSSDPYGPPQNGGQTYGWDEPRR